MDESHVEHTVSFVKYDVGDDLRLQDTAFDKVEDTTWSTDDEVIVTSESADLRTDWCTTDTGSTELLESNREFTEFTFSLKRELTSWSEDDSDLVLLLRSLLNKRKKECSSFASTCLSNTNHVSTLTDEGNDLVLDR